MAKTAEKSTRRTKTVAYDVAEQLRTPEEMAAYLDAWFEEAPDDAWAYPAVTWIDSDAYTTYFNYKGGISLKLKILPAAWFYK